MTIWSAAEYGDAAQLERLISIGPRAGIKLDGKGKVTSTSQANSTLATSEPSSTLATALALTSLYSTRQNGNTPLHLACGGGHYHCVAKLLDAGAWTESQNEASHSLGCAYSSQIPHLLSLSCEQLRQRPFHLAARSGRVDVVELLIDYHSDHEAQTEVRVAVFRLTHHASRLPAQIQSASKSLPCRLAGHR